MSDRAGPLPHVVFRLDAARYALPLAAVREVVLHTEPVVRVPRSPPEVLGVVNLRGRVVTVIDFARLLELPEPREPARKLIVLDRGRRDLSLLVGEVDGIESVDKVAGPPREAKAPVRGVTRVKGWAVTLLDVEALDASVTGLFERG